MSLRWRRSDRKRREKKCEELGKRRVTAFEGKEAVLVSGATEGHGKKSNQGIQKNNGVLFQLGAEKVRIIGPSQKERHRGVRSQTRGDPYEISTQKKEEITGIDTKERVPFASKQKAVLRKRPGPRCAC